MPWELIYTSAPRGLAFGQSGFCTVARTADLREALIPRLEQISAYHYLNHPTGTDAPRRNPTIFAFRILDIRGTKFHVLSRILPCGVDFTARTNHLAQHLIFGVEELVGQPSPAAILRDWDGWRSAWQGEPRLLDPLPAGSFSRLPPPVWPAETWRQVTGDAGRAAGLLEADLCRGCYLLVPPGGERMLLDLFCETQQLLNPAGKFQSRAWQHTFTTFLQGEDLANDFQWRGCQVGTPGYEQAVRRAATVVPIEAVRAPNNPLARLAREGPRLPSAPAPALPAPGSRTSLTINRPQVRNAPRRPGQADWAGGRRGAEANDYSGGWNVSISIKSLIGIGIAIIILAGLLVARHYGILTRNHPLASTLPPAPSAGETNSGVQAPAAPVKPSSRSAPSPNNKPAPPLFNQAEANQEVAEVLPDAPTYVFVVPALSNDIIPLAGIPPLVKLLQQFGHIDVTPTELDLRFALKSWSSSPKFLLFGDSDPNKRQLRLTRAGDDQPAFVLDYSSLPNQPIRLETRFNSQLLASLSSFSLLFQAARIDGLVRNVKFEPFNLLVVNAGNPPPPLKLDKYLLRANQGTLELTLGQPLWDRLKQFQTAGLAWQLHPYIITTNASGANISKDLYQLLPPEVQPSLGTGLGFAEVTRMLTQKREEPFARAARLKEEMQQENSINLPPVDMNLPLGKFLGQTNEQLLSFNAYSTHKQEKPSSHLFTNYLENLAKSAKKQQPWLADWLDSPSDRVPQRLQRFFKLWAANLPADSVAPLRVTNVASADNYFVLEWKSLRWVEDIEKLTKEKDAADKAAEKWQHVLDLTPQNLEQVAEVRLFLADPNNPNNQLEVIRFADFKRR